MKYYIPVHSFVDLITNSSTEIYVQANEQTVKTLKELIAEILKVGKSPFFVDDLFEISLETKCNCKEEGYLGDGDEECNEDCELRETHLVVKSKRENCPEMKRVLDVLNDLTGLFEYGERAN